MGYDAYLDVFAVKQTSLSLNKVASLDSIPVAVGHYLGGNDVETDVRSFIERHPEQVIVYDSNDWCGEVCKIISGIDGLELFLDEMSYPPDFDKNKLITYLRGSTHSSFVRLEY